MLPPLVFFLVLKRFYVYWVVDKGSIQEHRFWKVKTIPLSDVWLVAGRGYLCGKPMQIKVDYFRVGAPPKSGRIFSDPADVNGFVEAIRRFAPMAAIDV